MPMEAWGTEPTRDVLPLRVWTTEKGSDRLAVIRYLFDVQAALAGHPPVIFEPIDEGRLIEHVRSARTPGSRVPMPHVINTGADALMALDAEGLLSGDGERVVHALGEAAFASGALAALRRPDGALTAIPFHGWPQIVWARRDWLDDSGVPGTVDGLRRAAHAFFSPAAGRRGVILGTSGDIYTQQCFMMIARAFGAAVFDADGAPALQTRAMIAALEAYADLARAAGPGRLTWRARDYYLQGRAAFLFYSTFLMDDLAIPGVAANSLTADNFDDLHGAPFDPRLVDNTAAIATLDGSVPGAIGAFSSINGLGLTGAGSQDERRAARTLALFLFRRDAYIAWLHMAPGGMLPVVDGILEDDAFMRDRLGVFRTFGRETLHRFGAALRAPSTFSVVRRPDVAHASPKAGRVFADGLVGRMVARVLEGSATPRQSARRAQAEAVALVGPGGRPSHLRGR